MDDLVLDIFANARKSKLSRKDFDEIPVRDSQKVTGSSKKVSESTLSIAKNLDEPRSSDAFKNLMKGVYDMGKRIEQKYSNKKIQQDRPSSSKQTQSKESNKKWRPEIDKIKQERNQDDDHNKEDIGVGTSHQNLHNPYLQPTPMPIRIISPEGSRIVAGPDNSRIVFPPQVVQVRPLSPSTHYQNPPMNSRVIMNEPISPARIMIREPVNRQTASPTRIVSYSPPPQRVSPAPQVRFIHPPPISPPPQYVQRPIPINYNYVNQQPYYVPPTQNNYPIHRPIPLNQQQIHQYPNQCIPPSVKNIQSNIEQKEPKISGTPSPPTGEPSTNPSKSMTPQQYEALLQKQYQLYNSQNSQLMKHLSQLTQQQKKQYVNQQLLQQALKKTQNTSSVKNVINQKRVTKIVQKKVINKENIQNVQNIRNEVNMCNVSNQFNMQNVQNLQNIQAIQYLQQLYGNDPKMLNNQILLKQLQLNMANGSEKRLPLQEYDKISVKNISNKSIPSDQVQKVGSRPPPPIVPMQQQITQQKIQKQIFTEALQRDIDKLDIFQEVISMDYHISDLHDIKTQNVRDGMNYLKKMDEIINRYGQKPVQFKQFDQKVSIQVREEPFAQTLMNRLFSNIFTSSQLKQQGPILVDSVISPLPETHTAIVVNQKPQQQQHQGQKIQESGKKSKHFLTLTKDMVVDFISGIVN